MRKRSLAIVILLTALAEPSLAQFVHPHAGNGIPGYNGPLRPAVFSSLNSPAAIAVDATGGVYIADTGNHRIRFVTDGTRIESLIGTGLPGFSATETIASLAPIDQVLDVAVDATGSLYISDASNARIRRRLTDGTIETLVGNGNVGYVNPGSTGTNTPLGVARGLVIDPTGNLVFADGGAVFRLESDRTVSLIAGATATGNTGDGGLAASARFLAIADLAYGPTGQLYIADAGDHRVRYVNLTGSVTTVVGTGTPGFNGEGIAAGQAQLDTPVSISVDIEGLLYVADNGTRTIRRVDRDGRLNTFAGGAPIGPATDHIVAIATAFGTPVDIEAGLDRLYVADKTDHRVRVIETAWLGPQVINDATRKSADLPGSATLEVLATGGVTPGGSPPPLNARRLRQGGLLGLEFDIGDRSNAGAPLDVSVDLSAFGPSPGAVTLIVDGTAVVPAMTGEVATFLATPDDARSISSVSMTFDVGAVPSSPATPTSVTGSVVIVDVTDTASGESVTSAHPLNVAFTGDPAAGVISTTVEIDNTSPSVVAIETLVSHDRGSSFITLVTPSVSNGDIVMVSVQVQSDSIASTTQSIANRFNPQLGAARIVHITESVTPLLSAPGNAALFLYQVKAEVGPSVTPINPQVATLQLWDNLGNVTAFPSQPFGINTTGVTLSLARLFVNGQEPPIGAFTTGPDLGLSAVAELREGDQVELIANLFGYNTSGLETITADFSPLYAPELSALTDELLPSATSEANFILTATWTVATIDLAAGGIANVTFADAVDRVTSALNIQVNAIPAEATPTAMPGILGSPGLALQPNAKPAGAVALRIRADDSDSGFQPTEFDSPLIALDTKPPTATVAVQVTPPIRPAPSVPEVPDRVRAGNRLTYTVELINAKADSTGDDGFSSPEGFDGIRADLHELAGEAARAVAASATSILPQLGAPSLFLATFVVPVGEGIGNTLEESTVIRSVTFELQDDVGHVLQHISSPGSLAVDNAPPGVLAADASLRLVAGNAYYNEVAISAGSNIPIGSRLEPGTRVRAQGMTVTELLDDMSDITGQEDHLRLGLERAPIVDHEILWSESFGNTNVLMPVFEFVVPPLDNLPGGIHHVLLTATDTVGNAGYDRSNTYFLIDGEPEMTFAVQGDEGRINESDATGLTLTQGAGGALDVQVTAIDYGSVSDLEVTVTPNGGFELSPVQIDGIGTITATAQFSITPTVGMTVGPYVVSATASDEQGFHHTERFEFRVDQPPVFSTFFVGTISESDGAMGIPTGLLESVILQETQRLDLKIYASDPDLSDTLHLSASSPWFHAAHVEPATFAMQSATTPDVLPLFAPSQVGEVSAVLSLSTDIFLTDYTVGAVFDPVILQVTDDRFSITRTFDIIVSDNPVSPTLAVTEVSIDGQSVPYSDPIALAETSTLIVRVQGETVTGVTTTVSGEVSSEAGTLVLDGASAEWTFTPGLYGADVPDTGPVKANDSPSDPTQVHFEALTSAGLTETLNVSVDVINTPAPPILTVTASIGTQQIVSPASTLVFVDGEILQVEASAEDSDSELMAITFSGLEGGQTTLLEHTFGYQKRNYGVVLPRDVPEGGSIELDVSVMDSSLESVTHTITLFVRKGYERLEFDPVITATIHHATGAIRQDLFTKNLLVLDTDTVTLEIGGRNTNVSEPVTLQADGTLLRSSLIESASFAGQSLQEGYTLPFVATGQDHLVADLEFAPGISAATYDGMARFDIDLRLASGVDFITRTVTVDVQDVDVSGWAYFDTAFQAIVEHATGGVNFESIESGLTVLESDIVRMLVIGHGAVPDRTLIMTGSGTVLAATTIAKTEWGDLSTQKGDRLPFTNEAPGFIHEAILIEPGFLAVPLGQSEATYNLDLQLTDGVALATRTVSMRFLDVDQSDELAFEPPFSAVVTDELGGVHIEDVTDRITLKETDRLSLFIAGSNTDQDSPTTLELRGTALSSDAIQDAVFNGYSSARGDSPPFSFTGSGTFGDDLQWAPGIAAATVGVPTRTYTLDMRLSDGTGEETYAMEFHVEDVDVASRVLLVTPFAGKITDIDGIVRSVSIAEQIELREDERLELEVVGLDELGLPVSLTCAGSVFEATSWKTIRVNEDRVGPETAHPCVVSGTAPLTTHVLLEPGFLANPSEDEVLVHSATFTFSNAYGSVAHAFDLAIVPVIAQPIIRVTTLTVNGLVHAPTSAVTLNEYDNFVMELEAWDPWYETVEVSAFGGPNGLQHQIDDEIAPARILLNYRPGPLEGNGLTQALFITAANDEGRETTFPVEITVLDTIRRPTLSSGMILNGNVLPFESEPEVGRNDILTVTFEIIASQPEDYLHLAAEGTLFSSPLIERVTFDRFDPRAGDLPPYGIHQPGIINATMTLYPGAHSVPIEADRAEYTFAVDANNGVFGIGQPMRIVILPAPMPPVLTVSEVWIDGVSQPVRTNMPIPENVDVEVRFDARHPLQRNMTLVPRDWPFDSELQIHDSTPDAYAKITWQVGSTAADISPVRMAFRARSDQGLEDEAEVIFEIEIVDEPARLALEVRQGGDDWQAVEDGITVREGTNVQIRAAASDPDEERAIVRLAAGVPPGAILDPANAKAEMLGADPAEMSVSFTPLGAGTKLFLLFTAGDSDEDGAAGDTQTTLLVEVITSNLPPEIQIEPTGEQAIWAGDVLIVFVTASDPEDDLFVLSVDYDGSRLDESDPRVLSLSGFDTPGRKHASVVFETFEEDVGTHELLFRVEDEHWETHNRLQLTVELPLVGVEDWFIY